MTLIDNIIKDLLKADPEMSVNELYDHSVILGTHNGLTENEVRQQFQTCRQINDLNKDGNLRRDNDYEEQRGLR